jgi:hypothetical protein
MVARKDHVKRSAFFRSESELRLVDEKLDGSFCKIRCFALFRIHWSRLLTRCEREEGCR